MLPSPEILLINSDGNHTWIPALAADYPGGVGLAGITIRWGRESIGEKNQPTTATFQVYDPTGVWGASHLWLGRFIYVYYLGPDTATEARTFGGRITDLEYHPDTRILTVTAVDWIGLWGNLFVGGAPMTLDQMETRIGAIRTRSGDAFQPITTSAWEGGTTLSEREARVGPVDWDHKALTDVLDETLDGIDHDWFPTITPTTSRPTMIFTRRTITFPTSFLPTLNVAASELLMEGEFAQRIGDLATAVAINHNDGAGVGSYHYQQNATAVAEYGERTHTVTTHLYDPADEPFGYTVGNLAGRLLNRMAAPRWKTPALVTRESLMTTTGFAEHLVRRDINERMLHVAGIAPTMPIPRNEDGTIDFRIIGGTMTHDGDEWHFTLSCA